MRDLILWEKNDSGGIRIGSGRSRCCICFCGSSLPSGTLGRRTVCTLRRPEGGRNHYEHNQVEELLCCFGHEFLLAFFFIASHRCGLTKSVALYAQIAFRTGGGLTPSKSHNRKLARDPTLGSLRGCAASAIILGLNPAKLRRT